MTVILLLVGVFVLIVVSSIIGARRGTPMAFDGSDPDTERARAMGHLHAQHHDHGDFGGPA